MGEDLTNPFYVEETLPGDAAGIGEAQTHPAKSGHGHPRAEAGVGRRSRGTTLPVRPSPVENYSSDWCWTAKEAGWRSRPPRLKDYTVPLRPFLGCVGVAPPGRMVSARAFRAVSAGTWTTSLTEGVTLCRCPSRRALLFMGDGHAAQGDGELTGNALETSMDIEFSVDVMPRKSPEMPRAEDDEYLMAMGIAGSLTEGLQLATTEMALAGRGQLNPSEVASVLEPGHAVRYRGGGRSPRERGRESPEGAGTDSSSSR